ncbi:MAG TPA: hypothetical protein DDY70_04585 [Clostridiales bacterium]|nr:hypothetical protein [Clostridiales bacterium]
MVEIVPVITKKQQKEFLNFPLRLYRDCPYFAPPLYMDEKKIFRADYVYHDTCETGYWLALREGKTVGRISAILQKASNAKTGEKRVRFTRFDAIDDKEVARALFDAVEAFARERGMDTVCGPLGFSDLEREGLLIEGFDELSTFEEQYNYDYYGALIESCGYGKEVDWLERKVYGADPEQEEEMKKVSDFVMKRYHLRFGEAKNTREFIHRYAEGFFHLLDVGYDGLYGTVPFTDGMKKMMIDNFMLIIDMKDVAIILNEKDEVVCLGICFPSLAKALQKSGGRLTPAALVRVLRAVRHPKILDLGLIAVDPAYLNCGVNAIMTVELMRMLREGGIEYAETNLCLEDNYAIQNMWKRFHCVQHKRRRAYVKRLEEKQ